jgi:hypothetical protein
MPPDPTPDLKELTRELEQLERALLDPAVRRDRQAVSRMLAEDFREFGSSGRVYDKTAILESLAEESARLITLEDFTATPLADGIVLATYISRSESRERLRSSIWRWDGASSEWKMIFHQGTPRSGPAQPA